MKFDWKELNKTTEHHYESKTWIAKVPGGWMIREICFKYGSNADVRLLFIEDKYHKWVI